VDEVMGWLSEWVSGRRGLGLARIVDSG